MVTAAYPNGLQSSFTWDSRHRLTALASPAASYSYALDPVGNRTSATETSGRTLSWSYDGVNRLTNESVAEDPAGRNGSVSYTLDPVGNRLAVASTLPGVASSSAAYSADDLLSTESYDLNGNVLSTGGKSFTYDSENRLIAMNAAMSGGAGSQVAIQYDGWGNRVAETANGTTTRFLVDDLNPTGYPQVVDELVNGTVTRQYTNGLERISEIQTISGKWTPSFYGYDGMGNVRQLSNLAGTITDNYEYDAFGNVILSTGKTPNNYLYRGEQYDATLGLQYLRARYYNPVTGRFLSKDPWSGTIGDPASLNKYSYAEGNPIAGRDPSGLSDLVESNLLVNLSEYETGKASGLRNVGRRVNCILDTAAATLEAITEAEQSGTALLSVNIDFSKCDGAAASEGGEKNKRPKTPYQCLDKAENEFEYNAALDTVVLVPLEAPIFSAIKIGALYYGIEPNDRISQSLGGTGIAIEIAETPPVEHQIARVSKGAAEGLPVFGRFLAFGAISYDAFKITKNYQSCLNGTE